MIETRRRRHSRILAREDEQPKEFAGRYNRPFRLPRVLARFWPSDLSGGIGAQGDPHMSQPLSHGEDDHSDE